VNRAVRKVAVALAVLLAALFVNLNIVQVVKARQYRDNPQNQRVLYIEYSSPRGQIIVDGTPVALSRRTNDQYKYLRVYPNGKMYAPVTGFYSLAASPSRYLGTTGVESAENSVLSGSDDKLFGTRFTELLTGRNPRGGNVELTVDRQTQIAAYQALIKSSTGVPRRGAVVALDPSTGAILAAVSTPSYDPSLLTGHDPAKILHNYDELAKRPGQPLLNRAFNQLYPPGSTFKTVVSAAALKQGISPNDQLIAPNGYYPETGRTAGSCPSGSVSCIENFGGETCQNGKTASLLFAFAKSCNTLFAALAVEQLHGPSIAREAKLFGFDNPANVMQEDIPVARSTVGTRADLTANGFLARTAFGQQDVRMTVLQGAEIAAAVANDGVLYQPYLVKRELAPDLSELSRTEPVQLAQVLNPDQAHQLQTMMEAVVSAPEGTAPDAALPDAVVAGKTGTADTGRNLPNGQPEPPDAWFVGYAMQNGQAKIAVAVLIENGGVNGNEVTGGQAAAPVARIVMDAYLRGHG
jgi:peptidoglycan glycosyltransferase